MTALNITPTPCMCNTGFIGPILALALFASFILGVLALLANIISGGKNFAKKEFNLSSPIKETVYAILICVAILFSWNTWGKGFFFRQINFEDLNNIELIEEIHPDSIKINKDDYFIEYYQKPFNYHIKYQEDRIGIKTIEDSDLCIEHYTGTYKVFLVTATFDYYILHIPKEN